MLTKDTEITMTVEQLIRYTWSVQKNVNWKKLISNLLKSKKIK